VAWVLVVCERAVKENMLRVFGDSPTGAGDVFFFFCCCWDILVFELEAVGPSECVSYDKASQYGLYFARDAIRVCLALDLDTC
jgi:hypothetical protein